MAPTLASAGRRKWPIGISDPHRATNMYPSMFLNCAAMSLFASILPASRNTRVSFSSSSSSSSSSSGAAVDRGSGLWRHGRRTCRRGSRRRRGRASRGDARRDARGGDARRRRERTTRAIWGEATSGTSPRATRTTWTPTWTPTPSVAPRRARRAAHRDDISADPRLATSGVSVLSGGAVVASSEATRAEQPAGRAVLDRPIKCGESLRRCWRRAPATTTTRGIPHSPNSHPPSRDSDVSYEPPPQNHTASSPPPPVSASSSPYDPKSAS